jgi:hypothetical protein
MQEVRAFVLLGLLALLEVTSDCTAERNAQLKPERLVGEYVYYAADPGAEHDPDRLRLRADGKYTLVHLLGGRPDSTEEGTWQLVNDPTPTILLGHAGFPVQIQGNDVRLLIDNDLAQWYQKIGS